jgi:hypothetical protein
MSEETKRIVAGVDGRFFVIQADGSIRRVTERGTGLRWVFNQQGAAEAAARNSGASVYDKALSRFL